MNPKEKEDGRTPSRRGKKRKSDFTSKLRHAAVESFNNSVKFGATHESPSDVTAFTRRNPIRVSATRVQDKENPKSWYEKYTLITPAANVNRPMEPIFNVAFNDNGTNGVPKFVDLDVEWVGYADTFMMDQVTNNAMQNIRLALKSNLTYSYKEVKACLVNGIALAAAGKILERDVHWNLYDAGDDFNFIKMYRLRNLAVGGYGIVPLFPADHLLDENLPYTSTIYDKIASMYNNIIRLPKSISEFLSHYLGSLFTLDKDGHNDQYLRINMHNMDWYADKNYDNATQLDVSGLTLDQYIDLLNEYSLEFAIVIADLRKCLSVERVGIQKYASYTYTFVYDKSLLQALVNGYTDKSVLKNNFLRMDQLDGVSDDLTQYLFMGAIQPADNSKSNVHAITILDMVLKVNSDANIKWPNNLDQVLIDGQYGAKDYIVKEEPFGLSIVTQIVSDNTTNVAIGDAEAAVIDAPVPLYTSFTPVVSERSRLGWNIGYSKGFFPSQNGYKYSTEAAQLNTNTLYGMVFTDGFIERANSSSPNQYFLHFLVSSRPVSEVSAVTARKAITQFVYLSIQGIDARNFESLINTIESESDPAFWFGYFTTGSNIQTAIKLKLQIWMAVRGFQYAISDAGVRDLAHYASSDNVGITFRTYPTGTFGYISVATDGNATFDYATTNANQYSVMPNSAIAPSGLFSLRSITTDYTLVEAAVQSNATAGFDALVMYVTQVVDYHIPIYYKRRDHLNVSWNDNDVASSSASSGFTLVKEDYIPYYYNVMDLIPLLYEMFVSLFAIDSVQKRNNKPRT